MIIVQFNGGLGNQMFQYACGKALAIKHNTSLVSDLSLLNKSVNNGGTTKRSFDLLRVFNINVLESNVANLKSQKPLFYRVANVFAIKLGLNGIQTTKYFIENKFSYNDSIEKVGKDCYLFGYWQSPKYFDSISSLILKEFTFSNQLDDKNSEMAGFITTVNSVSIHIRRTDFKNTTHGMCSLEYYEEAVKFISTKIANPHFFVFSDDINWVKKNLKLSYQCMFISGNSGYKSYIDMQLMSACKHNIIANSSFSWWGAWLNQNPNKIVIAPKIWFVDKKLNDQTIDLIPDTWKRM
jgi:hypothetical protein